MRIGLDDNTRDALHFVLLGSGVLLVLRLIIAGIGLLIAAPPEGELAASIATFRNGYLLSDPGILVNGGMELPGRLATAVLAATAAGVCVALIGQLASRLLGGDTRRAALFGARTGFLLMLACGLYAALLVPPRSARIDADGITTIVHVSLLDGISWPWPSHERIFRWKDIRSVEHRSEARSVPCWSDETVVLVTGEEEQVIASITPQGTECLAAKNEAVDRSAHLASLLNAQRLQ